VAVDDNSNDPPLPFFMGVEGFEELGRLPFEDFKYSHACELINLKKRRRCIIRMLC
jgi:hypothetical protein